MGTVLITGNTFPVKDQLRAMGGKWDADAKGWRVPADKADEARALVAGPPKSTGTATASRPFRHYKCVLSGGFSRIPRNHLTPGYPQGRLLVQNK
jgi:hypothetical protein